MVSGGGVIVGSVWVRGGEFGTNRVWGVSLPISARRSLWGVILVSVGVGGVWVVSGGDERERGFLSRLGLDASVEMGEDGSVVSDETVVVCG